MVYWLVQLSSLTMVAVWNVRWQCSKIGQCRLEDRGMICESVWECTQAHNRLQFMTDIDQSNTTKRHMCYTSLKMMTKCLTVNHYPRTKRH